MNRRSKERLDLRLLCRVGSGKVLSTVGARSHSRGLTQNLSRSGVLMRWLDAVAVPEVGATLTVDIELPADETFGPRVMRCRTVVVRIIAAENGLPTIAMRIRNIRFVAADAPQASSSGRDQPADASAWELESMPPATQRLN